MWIGIGFDDEYRAFCLRRMVLGSGSGSGSGSDSDSDSGPLLLLQWIGLNSRGVWKRKSGYDRGSRIYD